MTSTALLTRATLTLAEPAERWRRAYERSVAETVILTDDHLSERLTRYLGETTLDGGRSDSSTSSNAILAHHLAPALAARLVGKLLPKSTGTPSDFWIRHAQGSFRVRLFYVQGLVAQWRRELNALSDHELAELAAAFRADCTPPRYGPGEPVYDGVVFHLLLPEAIARLSARAP